jgi:hypothetical protein
VQSPGSDALSERFESYRRGFTVADLETFEALCFLQADTVAAPYSRLLKAPTMHDSLVARALVERAHENSAQAIHNAYATDTGSGAKIFAYALGSVCEAPGCIPTLINADGPEGNEFDWFECNIMHERGGAINSTFSVFYGCGLTNDTFHFFEDPFGKGSRVHFSADYLTEEGVEFAKWLFTDRIEALRCRG